MEEIISNRIFMRCPRFEGPMAESDQQKGLPHPPQGSPVTGELIELPFSEAVIRHGSYAYLLDARRSERAFSGAAMSREQLAFLLYGAQGVHAYRGDHATLRTVPSGGARHPFELYFIARNVDGLKPGLYRYVPMAHVGEKKAAVEYRGPFENHEKRLTNMLAGQSWAAKAPVTLLFSCVPYRAEWRYQAAAHRVMLIDLGHAGQNAMLTAAALGLGSCCIAAYDQKLCDEALGINGLDEYTVYAVPVGEVKSG